MKTRKIENWEEKVRYSDTDKYNKCYDSLVANTHYVTLFWTENNIKFWKKWMKVGNMLGIVMVNVIEQIKEWYVHKFKIVKISENWNAHNYKFQVKVKKQNVYP